MRISFWVYALTALIVFFIVAIIAASRDAKKAALKAQDLLSRLEGEYLEFIMTTTLPENKSKSEETEALIAELNILLKPRIEAILALIDSVTQSSVHVEFSSDIFGSLAPIVENYFKISSSGEKKLSAQQRSDFYKHIEDAVRANITKRMA